MRTLRLFIAHVLFITVASSQITISSSDFQKNLGLSIKTTSYTSSDTSGLRSIINASGANMIWNLAGKTFTASDTTTVILLNKSTSGAPQQTNSAFSSATLVNRQRTASKPLFTFWTYYSSTTTALSYYGYVQDSVGIVTSNQTNSPSRRVQNYPTSYLGTWSWASTVTTRTYGPTIVGIENDWTGDILVDSYGTVTTPEGTFPCLRIRSKLSLLFGFFTLTTYSYEFFDQNRTYARIDANQNNAPTSVSYFRQASVTGIADAVDPVPRDFQLRQNYPNPFNPSTIIEFVLPQEEFVTLKVYNALSQEVAALVRERRSRGKHRATFDAHNLPSGVYFYRLTAGNFIQTKKFLLVK